MIEDDGFPLLDRHVSRYQALQNLQVDGRKGYAHPTGYAAS